VIYLYRLVTFVAYVITYPYARTKAALGDRFWLDRIGFITAKSPADIWLHAASVGEVRVIHYLVRQLKKSDPSLKLHLTVMTKTGYKTATELMGDILEVSFFPLDVGLVIRRAFKRLKPRAIVIAETELWPNLISLAGKRKVPMMLVNGRMSAKAFGKYKLFAGSMGKLLCNYERFFLKSDEDAEHYRYLLKASGKAFDETVIKVTPDMKFDAPVIVPDQNEITSTRKSLGAGEDDFVLVAGSTRPGEEAIMAALYVDLTSKYKQLKIVIAPRHLERVEEIKVLMEAMHIPFSIHGSSSGVERMIIVDQLGLLSRLYAAADLAFVGGTLVGIGGHNLLEPVWTGTPVLFGPYLSNVKQSAEFILDNRLGSKVAGREEFIQAVAKVIDRKLLFEKMKPGVISNSPAGVASDYILGSLLK